MHSAPAGIGAPQGAPQRGEGDPDGPWLITIDDFLSSDESDEVIRAGSQGGKVWQRSQAGDGVTPTLTLTLTVTLTVTLTLTLTLPLPLTLTLPLTQAGDGVQSSRTSSTAWCGGACAQNPTIKAVEQRVSNLTLALHTHEHEHEHEHEH